MSHTDLKSVTQDLEKAGAIIAGVELKLGKIGHAKVRELERLRSKLNTLTRSIKSHERPSRHSTGSGR